MKKDNIVLSFDAEKLYALRKYMKLKNIDIESELEKSLDGLYTKNVPASVREFIDMKTQDEIPQTAPQKKQRPSKVSASNSDNSNE